MDGTDYTFFRKLDAIEKHNKKISEYLNSIESEMIETNSLLKQLIKVLNDGVYTKKKYPEGMGPL